MKFWQFLTDLNGYGAGVTAKLSGFKKKYLVTDTFCNACIQKYQNRRFLERITTLGAFDPSSVIEPQIGPCRCSRWLVSYNIIHWSESYRLVEREPICWEKSADAWKGWCAFYFLHSFANKCLFLLDKECMFVYYRFNEKNKCSGRAGMQDE